MFCGRLTPGVLRPATGQEVIQDIRQPLDGLLLSERETCHVRRGFSRPPFELCFLLWSILLLLAPPHHLVEGSECSRHVENLVGFSWWCLPNGPVGNATDLLPHLPDAVLGKGRAAVPG